MNYFIDWLEIEQDFGVDIPNSILCSIFDFGMIGIHLDTGEIQTSVRTGTYHHKGSYCDQVSIKISGSVIRMSGNPSRWNRLENLFGFDSIDSKLFHYFFTHRDKKSLAELIDTAKLTPLVHVSGMLGNYRGNTSWVVPLAWHPSNQNAVIVCDLARDISDLLTKSAVELREILYTPKVTLEAQGVLPVPLKLVHINKCPILAPAKTLLPENAQRLGIDRDFCLQNLAKLRQINIRDKVIEIFNDDRSFEPGENVETELYSGFFGYNDKNNMAILRDLPPERLSDHQLTFQDKRIAPLLFHYRARHFYKTLTRTEQLQWQRYRRRKLEKSAVQFEQDLQKLAQEQQDNPEKLALLQQVYEYGVKLLG
ncbi:exodeoxyribonuclease I [Actinobacillus seminis]|uniref:Exodeoxyribonuclease I n=1 Tax=Actinobacillus seminis TaxID=722 RepID=A0A263HCL2_9PAST|nr:exodeoxyribonuclease I [Actinobacillus seminis]OZN24841.1 exodeoxyribonuclease I [Actinobacillus seminis]SUU36783.1 exonuclease I [Actinobacillus seminis]